MRPVPLLVASFSDEEDAEAMGPFEVEKDLASSSGSAKKKKKKKKLIKKKILKKKNIL